MVVRAHPAEPFGLADAGPQKPGARPASAQQTLHQIFNEGYKASQGEKLVRQDLCDEAIRLTTLLAGHPAGNQPRMDWRGRAKRDGCSTNRPQSSEEMAAGREAITGLAVFMQFKTANEHESTRMGWASEGP